MIPPRPDRAHARIPYPGTVAWRRLHPAAIAVWLSGIVGGLAIPLVLLVIIGGEGEPLTLTIVVTSLAVIGSIIRWTRFWYRFDGQTLLLRGGLLQRWERTVSPARIQSVDVVQRLTHRVFGVVELRIEVAGGESTEAPLVALLPREAKELRALLMADHADELEEAEPEPPLVRMRPRDLLLAGVTGGRVAVVAAIAGWALQILPEEALVVNLDRLAGTDRTGLETVLLIAGTLLLASVLISLATTIVVYWDFRAVRRGDRLVVTRGLLQTRRSVVPVARIQAIRIEENLIRRAFGLASLRVLTAGYGKGSGDEQQSSMLVPVAPRERCLAIASVVMGSEALRDAELRPTPPRALVRRLVFASIFGIGAMGSGLILPEGALVVAIPVLPVALAIGFLSWRALGHAVVGRHLVARSGALLRRTTVADRANVQHVILRRSPTQRALELASVTLAIPKATASVIDVDRDVAEEHFAELASRLSD